MSRKLSHLKAYSPAGPFYGGAAVTTEVPWPYHVAIGGHPYLIDIQQYERSTVDVLRQAFDTQGEPGEQSFSITGSWKRTQSRWCSGAGQPNFDLDQDSDRRRFYTSKGLDGWTDCDLCMLPATALKQSSANTNLKLLHVKDRVYAIDGSDVRDTTTPETATWNTTLTAAISGAITDATHDGNRAWFAHGGNGIDYADAGDAALTSLTTAATTIISFAGNTLLGAYDNTLFELSSGATTSTTVVTHYNSDFEFSTITDAPNGVYAGGNSASDDFGQFFFVGFDTTTGGLATGIPAGRLPDGEFLHTLSEYLGVLLIGTSKGFRLGQIDQSTGTITIGPLVTLDDPVRCFEPQSEFVWFGWTDYDSVSTGLGRMDLSRFTEPLVPAYASDLMAGETGSAVSGNVTSAITFGGKRYFAVGAAGFYGEEDDRVESGTIDSGWVDYGTIEQKIASSVDLRTAPLDGSIAVTIESEAGTEYALGTLDTADALGPNEPFGARNLEGRRFKIKLTFTRSSTDTTLGPCLRWWTLRIVPAPLQVEEIAVPVILHDQVATGEQAGQSIPYDVAAEWAFLKGLESTRSVVAYQEGTETLLVTVRQVGIPKGQARSFSHDRSAIQGTALVRLVTVEGSY